MSSWQTKNKTGGNSLPPNNTENFKLIGKFSPASKLYNCADESVQNAINSHPKFFTTDPDKLLEMIEVLSFKNQIPWSIRSHLHLCHSMKMNLFNNTLFALGLRPQTAISHVPNVSMICPTFTSRTNSSEQMTHSRRSVWSVSFAKAGVLNLLDQNICHTEAFESALQDQNAMTDISDVATIQMSMYYRQKKKNRAARTNRGNMDTSSTVTRNNNLVEQESCQVCTDCGSHQQSTPGTIACHLMCPAWG